MREIIRRCRFRPYRKGQGSVFSLTMWDTGRIDEMGKSILGYKLTATAMERIPLAQIRPSGRRARVIFEGEDFMCSPMYAIDSDKSVASLMGFLTLRPGDTDADYFARYTDAQKAYCDAPAEALAMEVENRFGEL